MKPDDQHTIDDRAADSVADYSPPTVTFLGTLAELTQKQVGAADGTTFLGIDIGS